ncbi:MAG: hypothetical protein LBR93_02635 [Treponema sp.]|nr:hypothetical protein [Treponema sp.]
MHAMDPPRRLFLLLFFALSFPLTPDETDPAAPVLDVEAGRRKITGEARSELMSTRLGDTDVSLYTAGSWKAEVTAGMGFALTPLGLQGIFGNSPLLFTQEADLTLSLWIRDRWFVEAGFLDDYDLNTYRAGYRGKEGEAIQYLGFGNTGLDFPRFPYLDLGGESPSSLGVYGKFGGGNLTLHSLFRYDLSAREERVFVGDRERSYAFSSPEKPLRGRSFVLPDDNLDSPPRVYLQDRQGDLRDSQGRRWRLAEASEYGASAVLGLVELGRSPEGMVAAAYSKGGDTRPWESSLGMYANPALTGGGSAPGTGSGFLGEASGWFGENIDLSTYPQPGNDGSPSSPAAPNGARRPGAVDIGGTRALVLLEGRGFSPFENLGRYEAPSGSSAGASLVRLSSGERIGGYEILPLEERAVSPELPLYAAPERRRGLYELSPASPPSGRRSPARRWPLAGDYPELYLPGKGKFTGDLGLRFTGYGKAGSYEIGTDVVSGSVRVIRGGMEDPRFRYDESGGMVTLEIPASFSEVIRISYLKKSADRRLGSLAAGMGVVYQDAGPFSAQAGLGLRWNLTGETYSGEGMSNPGTVGFGAGTYWTYDRLKFQVSGGLGFDHPDTTGLYRAAGMEGNEIVLSMPAGEAFISEAPAANPGRQDLGREKRAPLVYRNYLENGIGGASLMNIDWGGASVVPGKEGPYPARDPALPANRVLAAEFDLEAPGNWTGFQVPLGDEKDLLEWGTELAVPFRFYRFSDGFSDGLADGSANFKVLLQIGTLADKDRGFAENPALVMEKTLYPPDPSAPSARNPASFNESARLAIIRLTEDERRKIKGANYLRLLIVNTGTVPRSFSGRVLLAPPILRGARFRPILVEGGIIRAANDLPSPSPGPSVAALEGRDSSLEAKYGDLIRRLHDSGGNQRVLEVGWEALEAGQSAGADGRFGVLPLADYRTLSFFVRGPEIKDGGAGAASPAAGPGGGTLRFILAGGSESLGKDGEIALDAEIPLSAFRGGEWSKVELHYGAGGSLVKVEGNAVPQARLQYRPGVQGSDAGGGRSGAEIAAGRVSYAAIFVSPAWGGPTWGTFALDEIILEDPSPLYRYNGGAAAQWNHPGELLGFRGRPALSDLSLNAAMETTLRGDPFTEEAENSVMAAGRSSGELSLFGTRLRGNLGLSLGKNSPGRGGERIRDWNAGHGVSRSFGPLSFRESFADSPPDKAMNHVLGIELNLPLSSRLEGEALYREETLDRKWNAALNFDPKKFSRTPGALIPSVSLGGQAAWSENTGEPEDWLSSYGETWGKSWAYLAPDLGEGTKRRDLRGTFSIREEAGPVGAELGLEGLSAFSRPGGSTQSSGIARLDIPVSVKSYRIVFRGERAYQRTLRYTGDNALDDLGKARENLAGALPLWRSAPFYSLFGEDLGDTLDEIADSSSGHLHEYSSFRDGAGLSFTLPDRFDLKSLIVPHNLSFRLSRTLERKLDTRFDMLSLNWDLGFSGVNLFGAQGVSPLFRFYRTDEFSHRLEGVIAFPRNERTSWRIQSSVKMDLFGFTGAELGLSNTFTAAGAGKPQSPSPQWLESLTLDWIVPTRRSLLSVVYDFFTRALRTQGSWLSLAEIPKLEYEQLRKESLELALDYSGEYLKTALGLRHESILRITGRLKLSVFAKVECSQDSKTEILSFLGLIGTSLSLSF